MNDDEPEELINLEINLRRFINANGDLGWRFHRTDGAHPLETLALLMAGIVEVFGEMLDRRRDR